MPDDELLDLAEKGKLRDPAVLHAQVRRMMADPKGRAMVVNFSGQWLQTRNLDALQRDAVKFPEFDAELRDLMRTETEMFFEAVVEGGPQRTGFAGRKIHVPERASRQVLRHRGSYRTRVPARGIGRPPARRRIDAGKRADGFVLSHPHLARDSREMAAGEHTERAASASAAGCSVAGRKGVRQYGLGTAAIGAAPCEPGMRGMSCADGPARVWPGELRRHRPMADQSMANFRWMSRAYCRTARHFPAPRNCERS